MTGRKFLQVAAGAALLAGLGAGTSLMIAGGPALAEPVTVHKTATCGCCGAWVDHLRADGFEVAVIEHTDLSAIKAKLGVPATLQSCHTAVVDGYVVEGHVPAADIRRLLAEKPDVAGLSVPGMPIGSPGMEMGDRKDPYDVIAFGDDAATVFSQH